MVYRPKEGFVLPVNAWLMGKLEDYVRQTLSAAQLAQHGLFDIRQVQKLVQEFYAGRGEHANRLLTLLAFQEWHALYKPSVHLSRPALAA